MCDLNLENCQRAANDFASDFNVENILVLQCDVTDQEQFESKKSKNARVFIFSFNYDLFNLNSKFGLTLYFISFLSIGNKVEC